MANHISSPIPKRIKPAIETKIKLLLNQQQSKRNSGQPPLVQNQSIPRLKTHGTKYGPFVLEQILKLGQQPANENRIRKNASKEPKYVADHVERVEKAVQTDSDLPDSDKRNYQSQVADPAIETPRGSVSSIVFEIGNVENLHQQISNKENCEKDSGPSLFETCLRGTKAKMKQNPQFQTNSMKQVIQTLEGIGMVGVRGDTCSGKTGVLYGAMQIFGKKNMDWNIILIHNEEHLRACYKKAQVLLVIDDILDQNNYMLKHLVDLKNYIDEGFWKVIFSYSNESYQTSQSQLKEDRFLDGGHVLNISVGYNCTNDEKIGILNFRCKRLRNPLQEDTSKQCVELVPAKYFLHYVKSYVDTVECRGKCDPIDFFQNPIEEMVHVLENIKSSNRPGFYILFCCSILGCTIDITIPFETQLSEHAMEISKWLLASNDNPAQNRDLERLQYAVRDVPTEFIESTGNHKYRIHFGCVVRAVQLIILKELNFLTSSDNSKLFYHALLLCDSSIVFTYLHGDDRVSNSLQLKIHQDNFRHLAERFIVEIQSGHVKRVGHHTLFDNDNFKRKFISKLEHTDNKKNMWGIFSTLDKHTNEALIVFAVKHDKPDHAIILTNFILNSKRWKKYSTKQGKKVERHLLVLQQNALALRNALQYQNRSVRTALIDSVFFNVHKINKWENNWRQVAISVVIEIHAKILSERPEITKEVIKLCRNINIGTHINNNQQTLLHLCLICQNEHIFERVLKHRKGEINRQDCLGQTPLHIAVQYNNLEAVKHLTKCEAVADIKDRYGNSALHLAVHKNKEILELLIHVNGTDVNVRNKDGKTPLQLTRESQKTEHMEILRQADVQDD